MQQQVSLALVRTKSVLVDDGLLYGLSSAKSALFMDGFWCVGRRCVLRVQGIRNTPTYGLGLVFPPFFFTYLSFQSVRGFTLIRVSWFNVMLCILIFNTIHFVEGVLPTEDEEGVGRAGGGGTYGYGETKRPA